MEELREEADENRDPNYDIDPLFVNRWSPRAMTGESLDEEEFMPLFEAARWAPSSYNNQHWRFMYATRDSEKWETFLDLLGDANRVWAKDGAVLVVIASKKTFDHNGEFAKTHRFDTGAAWENLALEGARRELVVHGMQGFDYDGAREVLEIPEEYTVEAMFVIGKRAPEDTLSEELQEREEPKGRKDIGEILTQGEFDFQ